MEKSHKGVSISMDCFVESLRLGPICDFEKGGKPPWKIATNPTLVLELSSPAKRPFQVTRLKWLHSVHAVASKEVLNKR